MLANRTGIALAIVAGAVVSGTPTAAQSLGFRAGIQQSSFDFDVLPVGMEVGSATSWHAGAYVGIPVTSVVSVVAEARYANRGWKLQGTADADATAAFIEVPLLARIGSSAPRPMNLHLVAGPVFSFRLGCNVTGEVGGTSVDQSCARTGVDVKDQDIGLMLGAGLDLAYVGWTLVVDGAVGQGLLNVSRTGGSATFRAFMLSVGVEAPFGH